MPTVTISEADLQAQITELATMLGWRVMHVRRSIKGQDGGWVTATSIKGWPDLHLSHEAHQMILYRELKTEKGRLSDEQIECHRHLRAAGADVDVWRPSDWPEIEATLRGEK